MVKNQKTTLVEEEEKVAEIPFDKRPVVSLIPSEDGHWLKLIVEKLSFPANSLDYELLYTLPDGRTQGVPGTVSLSGIDVLERDLLLGSESSGKFRYDEGVEKGVLTLRFRDDKGKLLGKLTDNFRLFNDIEEVASDDLSFKYTFDKTPKGVYFVVVSSFGVPKMPSFEVKSGPYGIFSSSDDKFPGEVEVSGTPFIYQNDWIELKDTKSDDIGIFVTQ